MTRDELREQIANLLERNDASLLTYEYGLELADQILALFEGYQSPSDINYLKTMWEDEMRLKGYKSPEEVAIIIKDCIDNSMERW
jgi:hypothetical protein